MRAPMTKRLIATLLSLAALAAAPAMAEVMTFNIEWTGGGASALATLTMDTSYIQVNTLGQGPVKASQISIDDIQSLTVTVQGAAFGGNGTYGKSDFSGIYFDSWGLLDYSRELVGQRTTPYTSFGSVFSGLGGEFDLISNGSSSAPSAFQANVLRTGSILPNLMALSSITASPVAVSAVPEPSAWLSLAGGLGLIGLMARRRRRA